MKNLENLREWLIQRGVPVEELDNIEEPPVINDIGNGLMLSLQNDDDIGNVLVMIMMKQDELEARIAALEGGAV
jgi:hypothetical protein